jgi:2-polyprenyl-3-methyl-5-hydroxy-6-metoxy-1,4-benzoquinol methylase
MTYDARSDWDKRWSEERDLPRSVPSWVAELADELPTNGRGLDVAAGAGRLAVYMARRGLDVEAVDISPVGLALAREAARDEGLKLKTVVRDLTQQGLPEGRYDLIACFHYRQSGLFDRLTEALNPGGLVLAEVEISSASELSQPNEMLRACRDLRVLYYREGKVGSRGLARILARKT